MGEEFKAYLATVARDLAAGHATEHTHRPALKTLLETHTPGITATNEPHRESCGAPDFLIEKGHTHNRLTLGYAETKDVTANLDEVERSEQLHRYRAALPNLVLTNYLEFRWYVDGEKRLTGRLGHLDVKGRLKEEDEGEYKTGVLLDNFLTHEPLRIGKAKDLALRMARLTHLIRDTIVQAFDKSAASDALKDLRRAFAQSLIPDLMEPAKTGEFADMYAQTIAYGLFAARCFEKTPANFSRDEARHLIPKTNPFLRTLFDMVSGTAMDGEPYVGFVDDLVQLLGLARMDQVLADFGSRTKREDPVVHFYETFLAAYDPKLRKSRGVYFTPEPVVSYIVRSVDHILKTSFSCPGGLADAQTTSYSKKEEPAGSTRQTAPRVLILDPACGTGTFLYAVVDHIRDEFMKKGNAGMWSGYVKNHLLPRLFGFELLMAPYAVAHFKLGMQLAGFDLPEPARKNWAYDFEGDERLGVYLTNTLEEAAKKAQTLFGPLRVITEEANAAAKVKRELPVLVVLGNPPYSPSMFKGRWILSLVEDYKWGLKEKKADLNREEWKFLRFAQWRVEQSGAGIVAFIINNTFLDALTHRALRRSLGETFQQLYFLNLHGSTNKGEQTPAGDKDENVFDIKQGVTIAVMVKTPAGGTSSKVLYSELWGSRDSKYTYLAENSTANTAWKELTFSKADEQRMFVPHTGKPMKEYAGYWGLAQVFAVHQNGIKTDRDKLFLDFDRQALTSRMELFFSPDGLDPSFAKDYGVSNSSSYDILSRRRACSFSPSNIHQCLYRPFDKRWLYYDPDLTSRAAWDVEKHMLTGKNLALLTTRQTKDKWDVLVVSTLCGHKSCSAYDINTIFPMLIYSDYARRFGSNASDRFVEAVAKALHLESDAGAAKAEGLLSPRNLLAYIYGIFYCPTYRTRYAEFLKSDFPRIPFTYSRELFRGLCEKGSELVALHLLESPLLNSVITHFPAKRDDRVEKGYPKFVLPNRVHINAQQYFEGVPENVWAFHVGGYQVAHRWLKDRQGRQLSYEDLTHYQKTITALHHTIRIMQEIDALIPKWPLE